MYNSILSVLIFALCAFPVAAQVPQTDLALKEKCIAKIKQASDLIQRQTKQLMDEGYDPCVSFRIVLTRPDVAQIITGPNYLFSPAPKTNIVPCTESVSQMRTPIIQYRGIAIPFKKYNPRYFSSEGMHSPNTAQSRSEAYNYSAGELRVAEEFARGHIFDKGEDGLILEFQIPKFMDCKKETVENDNPIISVVPRDWMPSDLPFVMRIGFVKRDVPGIIWLRIEELANELPTLYQKTDNIFKFDGAHFITDMADEKK